MRRCGVPRHSSRRRRRASVSHWDTRRAPSTSSCACSACRRLPPEMALSLYIDRPSALHRRQPLAKLAAMTMLFVATFLLDDPRFIAPLTLLVLVATAAAGAFENLWRLRWIIIPVFV